MPVYSMYAQVCVSDFRRHRVSPVQQTGNKDRLMLGKYQNFISQLSCGVSSGEEESENRNLVLVVSLFSLSVG